MVDHEFRTLAAMIPNRRDLLDHTLRHLDPDHHFVDPTLRSLYKLVERYAHRTGAIIPEADLADLLERSNVDAGRSALLVETYRNLSETAVADSEFQWSIQELREMAAERATSTAFTSAMTVLTRGLELPGGRELKGHQDARNHLLSLMADIDRNLAMQDAPEGDVRNEMDDLLTEYADRKARKALGQDSGILFGLPAVDAKIGGFQRGELDLIAGFSGRGKALRNDQRVLTPDRSFVPICDLRPGDRVVDPAGEPLSIVTGVWPQGMKEVFEIRFSDGATVFACGEHLWTVMDKQGRKVMDTKTIRKLLTHRTITIPDFGPGFGRKQFMFVNPVGEAECTCISVSASSKSFVTEGFTPTHNTTLVTQLAWDAAVSQGKNVVMATTETLRVQVRRKLVARHSKLSQFDLPEGLNTRDLRDASLTPDLEDKYREVVQDLTTNPAYGNLYIAQVPRGATIGTLESKLVRLQRQFDVDLVIVDYLALFRSDRRRQSDREELNSILKETKQLATTFNDGKGVPIISPWQVSRAAHQEAEKVGHYTPASLAETSEATNSSDVILSLYAEDSTDRYTDVSLQILKNRDGETSGTIGLRADYATSFFSEKSVHNVVRLPADPFSEWEPSFS